MDIFSLPFVRVRAISKLTTYGLHPDIEWNRWHPLRLGTRKRFRSPVENGRVVTFLEIGTLNTTAIGAYLPHGTTAPGALSFHTKRQHRCEEPRIQGRYRRSSCFHRGSARVLAHALRILISTHFKRSRPWHWGMTTETLCLHVYRIGGIWGDDKIVRADDKKTPR